MDIVIDPGHGGAALLGGSTPHGARGPRGTLEKEVTLALAQEVAEQLGGARLTRVGDQNSSLAARAHLARTAPVFLSLHASSAGRGSEVWLHPRGGAASRLLAQSLQRALAALGVPDRGARAADLTVLRPEALRPGAAACLIEVDALGDAQGEARLCDAGERTRLAQAIAQAVREHQARALDVTPDSAQAEQSERIRRNIAQSLRSAEGTRFNQVHFDSGRPNFGIGSWTGARIAEVLDTYAAVAADLNLTDSLYAYLGGQPAYEALQARFLSQGATAQLQPGEQAQLEALGGDTRLQEAQVRQLARDIRGPLDGIDGFTSPSYPYQDGYMNAISEVAAHVLVHAAHQHGGCQDLIRIAVANRGGETALGQLMVSGGITELDFLKDIAELVVDRVQSQYRQGVRNRYASLLATWGPSTLSYYFHPQLNS